MKKIIVSLLICVVTGYCSKNNENYRVHIAKTFADGKPEILYKYSRMEGKESLAEVVTYNHNGQVLLIESPQTRTKKKFYWHRNGRKKSESNFHAGKIHGRWVKWFSDGSIKYDSLYHEGQLLREATYYKKTIISEKLVIDGQLRISREYKKGVLAVETTFREGEIVKKVFFYPDGMKSDEREYKHGILHGKSIYWDRNGEKRSEIIFKDGIPTVDNTK